MKTELNSRRVDRSCEQCGKSFYAFASAVSRGGGKFCSLSCVAIAKTQPIEDRFWARVRKSDGCWIWTGRTKDKGYGVIDKSGRSAGRPLLAHRVSWEIAFGPIPKGIDVLHKCDNPPCCNPAHLFLGTNQDNVDDMVGKSRQKRGENDANAKLNADKVRAIRSSFAVGDKTQVEIADAFGVSKITVFDIVHRKTWKHID